MPKIRTAQGWGSHPRWNRRPSHLLIKAGGFSQLDSEVISPETERTVGLLFQHTRACTHTHTPTHAHAGRPRRSFWIRCLVLVWSSFYYLFFKGYLCRQLEPKRRETETKCFSPFKGWKLLKTHVLLTKRKTAYWLPKETQEKPQSYSPQVVIVDRFLF